MSTPHPVVQVFGRDRRSVPQRLFDGDGLHDLTLPVDTTRDVRDGTYAARRLLESRRRGYPEPRKKKGAAFRNATPESHCPDRADRRRLLSYRLLTVGGNS